MKYFKNIFKLIFIISVVLMMIMNASCSDNNNKPANNNEPANDFTKAVENVSSSATELTIKSYTTGRQITIDKERPEFNTIINYIEKSTLTRSQPRFVDNDGKKTEVAIPYAIAFILEFTLSNGSKVVFDYGTDQFWFNTEDTIHRASVEPRLYEILEKLLKE